VALTKAAKKSVPVKKAAAKKAAAKKKASAPAQTGTVAADQ
jgi:hypothetical protein